MTDDPNIGTRLGGYRLDAVIATGRTGVIYSALSPDGEQVAFRLIDANLARRPGFVERWRRETELAGSFYHPNILPLIETGETADRRIYAAMRLVEGQDLATILDRRGPMEAGRASQIIAQVAAALDSAHARGLVHRGLGLRSVLVQNDGQVYVTGFGLTDEPRPGGLLDGEPGPVPPHADYAAPEQIRGEQVDGRADVYALGCILVHLLSGNPAFDAGRDEDKLRQHLSETPAAPSDSVPGLAPEIEQVIAVALRKEPGARYATAGEFARALEEPKRAAEAAVAQAEAEAETAKAQAPATRRGRVPTKKERVLSAWQQMINAGTMDPSVVVLDRTQTADAEPAPTGYENGPSESERRDAARREAEAGRRREEQRAELERREREREESARRVEEQRREAERLAAEREEADRLAAERAASDRRAAEEAEAQSRARREKEDAEAERERQERVAAEQAAQESAAAEAAEVPTVEAAHAGERVEVPALAFDQEEEERRQRALGTRRRRRTPSAATIGVTLLVGAAALVGVLAAAGTFSDDGGGEPAGSGGTPAAEEQPGDRPAEQPPEQPTERPAVATWPRGEDGYTVVTFISQRSRAQANAQARRARREGFRNTGVLRSSNFDSLPPGYWVTFVGRYDDEAAAQRAADRANAAGLARNAYARFIDG